MFVVLNTFVIRCVSHFCRSFAYSFLNSQLDLAYTGTSSGQGRTALEMGKLDFAGSDDPATKDYFKKVE